MSVKASMQPSAVPRYSRRPVNGPVGGRGPVPPLGAAGYEMYNQEEPVHRLNGVGPPMNAAMRRGSPGMGMPGASQGPSGGSFYKGMGSQVGSMRGSFNGGSAYSEMGGPTGGSFYRPMGSRVGSMRGSAYGMQNMGLGGPMESGYGNFGSMQRINSGMGGSAYGMGGPMGMGSMYGMGGPMGMGSMYGMGGPMGMGSMYGMGGPMGMGSMYGMGGPLGMGSMYGMGGPMGMGSMYGMGSSLYGMGGPMGMGSMYGMGGPMALGISIYGSVVNAACRRDGFFARNELIRSRVDSMKRPNVKDEKKDEKAASLVGKKDDKATVSVSGGSNATSAVKSDKSETTAAAAKNGTTDGKAAKTDKPETTAAAAKTGTTDGKAAKSDKPETTTAAKSDKSETTAAKSDKSETTAAKSDKSETTAAKSDKSETTAAAAKNGTTDGKAAPKIMTSTSLHSTATSADKKGVAEKSATEEREKKTDACTKEIPKPPTGTNIRGVLVIVKKAKSPSSATVAMKNATTVTTSSKDEFSFEEVITHTDLSKTMDSVMLCDLCRHWLAGHNSTLLLGAMKGEGKTAIKLGTQFIANSLSELEKESRKFDVRATMVAVRGGSEVKDLFKPSGASYEKMQLASSPVFGPALRGVTSKKITKSGECVEALEDGLKNHEEETELVVAFLVLKQIRKSSTDDDTVYLSSLCLVFTGEEVSHLTGLKEKKASEPCILLRYAVGGASNTVCLMAVSAEENRLTDASAVLEVGKAMREVKNSVPRSGNVKHFVEFTKRELPKQRTAAEKDDSAKRIVERMEKVLKDAEELLANPESEPKTY